MITQSDVLELIDNVRFARTTATPGGYAPVVRKLHDLVIEFVYAKRELDTMGEPKDDDRFKLAEAAVHALVDMQIRADNGTAAKIPTHVPQGRTRARQQAARVLDRYKIELDGSAVDASNVSTFFDAIVDGVMGPPVDAAPLDEARKTMFAKSRILNQAHELRLRSFKSDQTAIDACRTADRDLQRSAVAFVSALAETEGLTDLAKVVRTLTKGIGA